MKATQRRVLKIGSVACVLLLCGLQAWHFLTELPWRNSIDYSKRPPAQVFQFVTGMPVPQGVSNLQVAGRTYPDQWKHWLWIRCKVTEAAIHRLTANRDSYSGAEALRYIQMSKQISSSARYDAVDMRLVHWNEVARISQPEVYQVDHRFPNSAFVLVAYLILDRQNHTAYIFAFGD